MNVITCPKCAGAGTIEAKEVAGDKVHKVRCDVCNGKGKLKQYGRKAK